MALWSVYAKDIGNVLSEHMLENKAEKLIFSFHVSQNCSRTLNDEVSTKHMSSYREI